MGQSASAPPAARDSPRVAGVDLATELFGRANTLASARVGRGVAVAADAGAVVPAIAGGPGVKMLHLLGWIDGSRSVTRRLAAGAA